MSSLSGSNLHVERTLPMTVANTGFMLDRLGQDCAPLQYLRELTQNAIEGILQLPEKKGEVVWDVDWARFDLLGNRKLCVIDNGIGMTGDEQTKYVNQLSSSIHQQSHAGNFGVGAKIAAVPRNPEGIIYLSWKDGVGYMTHLWRDDTVSEYGLRQLALPDGSFGHFALLDDAVKPKEIKNHGTKVVLLGTSLEQDTMQAPAGVPSATKWIRRYLNTRYFRFPDGITVRVREGWEHPRSNTDLNVLRQVTGQQEYLEKHKIAAGRVELSNAVAHWWILKDEHALGGNSGQIASKGHAAALYQDELYEMAESRSGMARLQLFGVLFGYQQVVIYVEPRNEDGVQVSSNTSRTQLLINSEPLPWTDWAAEFRAKMPDEINALMEQVASGAATSDHRESIRERLRRIKELFQLTRYRPSKKGAELIDDELLTEGGVPRKKNQPLQASNSEGGGGKGGRAGDIYALFLKAEGTPGDSVQVDNLPVVRWVSVKDNTRAPGFLEDRAGKYLAEQNLVQANADFRVFTDMVERYLKLYPGVAGARSAIEDVVREWFEQALIEAIVGIQSLKDSREWNISEIGAAWSEEALTAAVMPRWHIDQQIKRTLGNRLGAAKDKAAAA